jgi:F0F1-type ATP synthase delta subunit
MKYLPTMYARAFWEVMNTSKDVEDQAVKNFVGLVAKNGDMSKSAAIIGEIEKLYVKTQGGRMVKLEFARKQPEDLVEQLKSGFAENDLVEEAINPSLVAGVRVTIDGEHELDKTMRRKLTRLFRN